VGVARWLSPSLPAGRWLGVRASAPWVAAALAPLLAILGLSCVTPAAAFAAPEGSPYEYGEVLRFGGFDAKAYNGGDYEREPTEGKFLDPTGFAVDPQDNTVYVVDRTSYWAANPTTWRIQQFKSNGELEGVTTFTLPNISSFLALEADAIEGLAVDHKAGRLYALVVGSLPLGSPHEEYSVAQELLAWSTTPQGGRLVAAPELTPKEFEPDPLKTGGAMVSSSSQLQPSDGEPLHAPQGIAIDRLEASQGTNPVVIEASNLLSEDGHPAGDTLVQQVATHPQGAKRTGDLLASWSGASVAGILGGSWGPKGVFDNPDGTLSVLLQASNGSATNAYVVRIEPDLSGASVVEDNAAAPPIEDFDEQALSIDFPPFNSVAGIGISNPSGAGSGLAQLSIASGEGDGPYAADFVTNEPFDHQFSPESQGPLAYWTEGEPAEHVKPNVGIRLLDSGTNGMISTPHGGTIANTLGNKGPGEPCNIGAVEATLAAGASGTLWVLDRGPESDTLGNGAVAGRQVIEFAPRTELPPGGGMLCPQPSGTFTMGVASEPSQSAEGPPLEVPAGTQVTFNAGSIAVKSQAIATGKTGKPFAYEWDFENGSHNESFTAQKIEQMKGPNYYFPSPTIVHTYTKPGTYAVTARLLSDYGTYTTKSGTVVVTPNLSGPHPQFTVATAGNQEIAFDATGSTPGTGKIVHYAWNWGDGSPVEGEEAGAPIVTHTYAAPGSYEVTLTVTNSAYQSATSAPQTVVVEASKSPPPSSALSGPLYAIPPPALYSIPPAPHGKHSLDLAARARFARGEIEVQISCPKGAGPCTGTAQTQTTARFATSAKRGGHETKPRRLALGRAAFHLAAGRHATVVIRISKQGLALLAKLGHLPILVSLAVHDGAGDHSAQTLRLTLAEPARDASDRARKHH
jgi:PKD repeat protein